MRILITILFLVSYESVSMADVYYCETTHIVTIRNHFLYKDEPQKFKFNWISSNEIKYT